MKFTLSWLKDHLETSAPLDTIVETLTDLGLEVEGVLNPAARLAPFTIAKILTAEQHPDADRLRVCQVDTDDGIKQIVCGAPNARAGLIGVLAKPGTYVPGIDTTIGVGKIRGVDSHGMLASERELELSDEHDGIIELPSGAVGQTFTDWLAAHDPAKIDPVIDIAITPNRQDALGVHGIARDLAARGIGTLKPQAVIDMTGTAPCPIAVTIAADTLDGAPHFTGRVIRGVENGPSPQWMQDRLRAIGLRPISALVDITNFFTYDQNRPLHVFDADKVRGNLHVHRAAGGETLTALDDKTYTLGAGHMVISDDNGAESIAGIMGGFATGCTKDTVNVFLESAYWDPVHIAHTGRDLKIHSDARYRFERGVDPAHTLPGLHAATKMILDICGGDPSQVVEAGGAPDTSRTYPLNPARVGALVGMDIAPDDQAHILTALGFSVSNTGNGFDVQVPPWRRDVQGEPDLVEEVARIASLTKLAPKPLPRAQSGVPQPIATLAQSRERLARRTIATLGYNECVTYSFIDNAAATLFGGGGDDVRLENPISAEMNHMRPSLLPGLLQAAARNQARGMMDLALFELGTVFHGGEPGDEQMHATGLLIGHTGPRDPHGARRLVDLYDVKADVEAVLSALNAPAKVQITRSTQAWWHPGRHGVIGLGPKTLLGVFGELHPKILAALDVKGPAMAFTLFPNAVPQPRKTNTSRGAVTMPEFQAVERDFAFVVDTQVEAATLVNAALGADKTLIEHVWVFDEFTGGTLGHGQKSIALTVRLQPKDKTLTEDAIEAIAAKIVAKVQATSGGTLRT